ncbi:MAG TPA: hypothetical protein LFV92_05790 [Rickettsia endosymbiont of Ceroptres masudai]|nr:hypothetical protein [Rickettsia endosymbiont of Ceroptres masudai]
MVAYAMLAKERCCMHRKTYSMSFPRRRESRKKRNVIPWLDHGMTVKSTGCLLSQE